ncbi:MAG: hypothetical protein CR217_02960 [Beijerinckiaceae bacterium]|nr:MAG: hypothetical protein CR217_02960 [Beijerinckiaceae bacterium]
MSDSNATCNGHNLGATNGDAHGTNNGCGINQHSNVPAVADPYAYLASNIPADTCGGVYPQEPIKHNDSALPVSNQWSGSYTLSGYKVVCGDQQMTANTTISATSNAVLVIENGRLDTNGFTFQSGPNSGLTIVFTGDPTNTTYQHYPSGSGNPSGSGTLDIAAPTTGTWKGMVLYQDPNLTDAGGPPGQSRCHRGRQHADLGPHGHGVSAAFQRHFQRRGQQGKQRIILFWPDRGRHYDQRHRRHFIQHAMRRRRSYPPNEHDWSRIFGQLMPSLEENYPPAPAVMPSPDLMRGLTRPSSPAVSVLDARLNPRT